MRREKVGEAFVEITANDSQLNSTLKNVEKRMKKMGDSMQRMGRRMTMAVTAPIAAGFAFATREALNLEGQMDKFNAVFADGADEMRGWVSDMRSSIPVARSELVRMTGALQDLLVPMGINRRQAQGMTQDWVELAAQLAAFNDVPVDQALEAIRSGIAGMSRPLRQFGIDARETTLQQTALAEGLIEAGEEMDEQTRQIALLIQATNQSKDAIDGYEDQLNSARVMQQEFYATLKDISAEFGQVLLPIWKEVIGTATELLRLFEGLDESTKQITIAIAALAAAIGPVLLALGTIVKLLPVIAKGFMALTGPLGWVIGAVALLGTYLVRTMQDGETFVERLERAWNNLGMVVGLAVLGIRQSLYDMTVFIAQAMTNILASMHEVVRSMPGVSQGFSKARIAAAEFLEAAVNMREGGADAMGKLADKYVESNQRMSASTKEESAEIENSLSGLENKMDELGKTGENTAGVWEEAWSGVDQTISRSMSNAVRESKNAGEVILDIADQIIDQLFQMAIIQPAVQAGMGAMGLPGFAEGGVARRGRPAIVGEEGPELFVPGMTGTVIPNSVTTGGSISGGGGGGGQTIVNIHNETGDDVETQRSQTGGGDEIIDVFIGAAAQDMARGGPLQKATSQVFGLKRQGSP